MTGKTPPPLAWLTEYLASLIRATGSPIVLHLAQTVNPLMYKVLLHWEEAPSKRELEGAYNMFQLWAHKNDCVPAGVQKVTAHTRVFMVVIKRRNGPEREDTPC